MTDPKNREKTIIRNTALLYFRMMFQVLIGLYTSRVILQGLGFVDYGLYNVIGGFVTMLGFLNSSLSGASARFITFELGKNNIEKLKRTFRCALSIHYILAFIILLLGETIGLWFLYNKLVIPVDKMDAAFWVYQCSILTVIISIISTPYNSLIIAHEKMNAFAYISIFEYLAKLCIALTISQLYSDRLITYAFLLLLVQIIIRFTYSIYCSKHFEETSYKWLWESKTSKEIFTYAGWTLNGNIAVIGYTQGLNVLLNMFFGPIVNAARGISVQIQNVVNQFCMNFMMATQPQITKSYANGDLEYMHKLIVYSSKISFFLMLVIATPICINIETILNLWLKDVPEHTIAFTQIMLITCLNYTLSNPTITAIHATGDLKKFQIIEGTILLSVVPIAYILLKFFSVSPETVFITYCIIETITQFIRIFIVYPKIKLKISVYFNKIIIPILFVGIPTLVVSYILYQYTSSSLLMTIGNCIISILSTGFFVFFLGLDKKEKKYVRSKIKKH